MPDRASRRQVEALAGYGVPETQLAGLLGIDPKTLRKHYRQQLDTGHTRANAKVAENLFRIATGEGREAVSAAIFWLKTRAAWVDPGPRAAANGVGDATPAIVEVRRVIIDPHTRTAAGPGDADGDEDDEDESDCLTIEHDGAAARKPSDEQ